jgi:rhomboid family GlyGly-CTERM serine protease
VGPNDTEVRISPPPRGRLRPVLASVNVDGRLGLALLTACALILLVQLAGADAEGLLRYERAGLARGQLWRLVTAHVIHLDLEHAALNSMGLVLMWALFARDYTPRQWLAIVGGAVVAIDAGLWLVSSTVMWYVGSSGALHGIMAAGTWARLRRRDLEGGILAVFLVAKIGYEQLSGALPLLSNASGVIVDAHLYGLVGGLAVAALIKPAPAP